jgi:hypothetical protein
MDKITHIHLKGPFIKTAKALLPEKPIGLGWYNNHWSFLFNNKPSKRVLDVAHKTGFIINENDSHTIITLPHIKEYEIKKATEKLDLFSKEYQDLSKKVMSVINKSINEDIQIIRQIKGNEMTNIEKKKKDWWTEIKHQINEIESYIGKMERNPFELNIQSVGPNKDIHFKNDFTGDIQYHLDEIKKIFKKAKEEQKSNKDTKISKAIEWDDYKNAIK